MAFYLETDIGYALFIVALIGVINIVFFFIGYRFLRRTRAYALAIGVGIFIYLLEAIFIRPTNLENLAWIKNEFWREGFFYIWGFLWIIIPTTIVAAVNFVVRLIGPAKWFKTREERLKKRRFKIRKVRMGE